MRNGGFSGAPNRQWQVTGVTPTSITDHGLNYKCYDITSSLNIVVVGPQGIYNAAELADMELMMEFMILAGGGGGGSSNNYQAAGGGGAPGGIKFGVAALTIGAYPIVVGAAGAGGTTGFNNGSNGGDSSAFGITASGGGGGGWSSSGGAGGVGSNGGNGGGGGNDSAGGTSTNVSTPAQGSAIAGQQVNGIGLGGMSACLAITSYATINSSIYQFLPLGLVGVNSAISGTMTTYARPGFALSTDTTDRAANTGDGGRGSWVASGNVNPGKAGGSGRIILRHRV